MPTRSRQLTAVTALAALAAAGLASGAVAQQGGPTYIQPGAPGEPSREITAADLTARFDEFTEADIRFLRMMIPHHGQALVMTDLVEGRVASSDVATIAGRIEVVQGPEIDRMQRLLDDAGEEDIPQASDWTHHAGMHGMLTQEEIDELRAAEGDEFDRLFLEGMIEHHRGAIRMVDTLRATGGGRNASVNALASSISVDQRGEIYRMQAILSEY